MRAIHGQWDIETNDPPLANSGARVYVDGGEVSHVRAFDTQEGWVEVLVVGANGNAVMDAENHDRALEARVSGSVVVVLDAIDPQQPERVP